MKKCFFIVVSLLLIFVLILTSCTEEKEQAPIPCVKCGSPASIKFRGLAFTMENKGIDISKCQSNGGIYEAYLCTDCNDTPTYKYPDGHPFA